MCISPITKFFSFFLFWKTIVFLSENGAVVTFKWYLAGTYHLVSICLMSLLSVYYYWHVLVCHTKVIIILELKVEANTIQCIYPVHTGVKVCRMLDIWSIALPSDFTDLLVTVQIKSAYLNDGHCGKNSIKRLIWRLINKGKAIVSVVWRLARWEITVPNLWKHKRVDMWTLQIRCLQK